MTPWGQPAQTLTCDGSRKPTAGLDGKGEASPDGLPVDGLPVDGLPVAARQRRTPGAQAKGREGEAMEACGCKLDNAHMQHSLLALVVIPELRISDEGLIDVTRFGKADLFVQ